MTGDDFEGYVPLTLSGFELIDEEVPMSTLRARARDLKPGSKKMHSITPCRKVYRRKGNVRILVGICQRTLIN